MSKELVGLAVKIVAAVALKTIFFSVFTNNTNNTNNTFFFNVYSFNVYSIGVLNLLPLPAKKFYAVHFMPFVARRLLSLVVTGGRGLTTRLVSAGYLMKTKH